MAHGTLTIAAASDRPAGLALRCLLAGLGYGLATVLAGLVVGLLRLPTPSLPGDLDATMLLLLRALGAVLLTLVLGPLSTRLAVGAAARTGVLFLLLWGIRGPITILEAYFFTTMMDQGLAGTLVVMAISDLLLAWLLAALFPPRVRSRSLGAALRDWFTSRPASAWLWRVPLAGLLFVPAYYTFGTLIFPLVRDYYVTPATAIGLRVPAAEVVLLLEVVRGLLFVLVLLPVVALLPVSRWRLALWLGVMLALLVGWEPLLANTFLPWTLRLVHGLEITADSVVHGAAIAWLLARPSAATAVTGAAPPVERDAQAVRP